MPIIIVHQSDHFGAANSKALEAVGFTAAAPDAAGGIIRRRADGEPDGVLEENAFVAALARLFGNVDEEGFKAVAREGAGLWASFGYTTAQEGRATPQVSEIAKSGASEGIFPIDVVVYPDVLVDRD